MLHCLHGLTDPEPAADPQDGRSSQDLPRRSRAAPLRIRVDAKYRPAERDLVSDSRHTGACWLAHWGQGRHRPACRGSPGPTFLPADGRGCSRRASPARRTQRAVPPARHEPASPYSTWWHRMTAWFWAIAASIAALVLSSLSSLVSEEIKGWLSILPHGILRFAATFLDSNQCATIYQEEWLPELAYILRCAEGRPITRLIRGTKFAAGLLISSRRVARRLTRTPQHVV